MFHTKKFLSRRRRLGLLLSLGLASILLLAQTGSALAVAIAPPLGTAGSFAVLGASTVTNNGSTRITGDLGVWPGLAITGFPPGEVVPGGTIHPGDGVAQGAQGSVTTAYNALDVQDCDENLTGQDLGGLTLEPGVYCFDSSAQLTGTLTLNALGNANAVWIFQIGSTLTTASNSSVVFINNNGGPSCNVFWQVGSSATLGTTTAFKGNILALASITLNTDADLDGRALARNGAVTLDTNDVTMCFLAPPPPNAPTLNKAFSPAVINAGEGSALTITLSNPNPGTATLSSPLIDTLPDGLVIADSPDAISHCGGVVTAIAGENTVTLTGGSIPASSGGLAGTCTVRVNVTANVGGNYINTLPAGALMTNRGNNAEPTIASLAVGSPNGPPTLGKAFSPSTINAGGISTLTITMFNPNSSDDAILSADLIDTLPDGLVIADQPEASISCGGSVTANPGETTVTLTGDGVTIPANGSCTVTVNVTADVGGTYVNVLPTGALETEKGNNAGPSIATLTVNPIVTSPGGNIPTLSEWGMMIFMTLLGLTSIYYLRRRKVKV